MWRSYLNSGLRSLLRSKQLTFVNLLGLTLGLVAFMLIFQYVSFERSFDRFHEKGDRIQRLTLGRLDRGTAGGAKTAGVMAPILANNYAGIKSFVRLRKFPSLVSRDDMRIHEDAFYYTDSTFFQVFGYRLKEGSPERVLREPNTLVLTEEAAERMFGRSTGLIGQVVRIDNQTDYRIDGVAFDPPANAHFEFDYLASIASIATHHSEPLRTYQINSWYAHYFYTFLELEEGVEANELAGRLLEASKLHSDPEQYELYGVNMGMYLQDIRDIHLDPLYGELRPQGNAQNLYILASAALLILLLAIVNYTNLTTAQSIKRVKEVALRKTLGAQRKQLMVQFIAESVFMTLLAFLLAISIIQALASNVAAVLEIDPAVFTKLSYNHLLIMGGLVLVTGMLGGLYPAFFVSGFRPTQHFRQNTKGKGSFSLRKAVIFFQFTISMMLVTATIVVFSQVRFMQSQELGIDTEQILVIPTYGNAAIHEDYDRFRLRLEEAPAVAHATLAELSPGDNVFGIVARFEGMDANRSFSTTGVDEDYLNTYGLELLAGRNFSRQLPTDTLERVIINRKLCQELGWSPEEAIGKSYDFGGDGVTPGFVIGVIEDFHMNSLRNSVLPLAMTLRADFYQKIAVKLNAGDLSGSIAVVEQIWSEVYPEWPFDYSLVDEDFKRQYAGEQQFGALFMNFTLLGLLIGAFGVFGLIQLMTEYRRKEISIRKVLGARIASLVHLLIKEYILLLALAFLVSAPAIFFLMRAWLADFAYGISVSWWMLGVAPLVIIGICTLTAGTRIFQTANSNPVNALRYE